jgi:hypothetical protein
MVKVRWFDSVEPDQRYWDLAEVGAANIGSGSGGIDRGIYLT